MSRWFRHYAGMMRDDKLVSAAIRSKQPVERVLWVWGAILESAAEIDDAGRYDVDAAEIAYFLRADQADIDSIITALAETGRLAKNCVVSWGGRQFKSDRSAVRVAEHRERKRSELPEPDVTPDIGNGDVTLHDCHGNSPETDTELETEEEISVSNDTDGEVGLKLNGQEGEPGPPEPDSEPPEILLPEHVVAEWNTVAGRLAKPRVRDLTPERRQVVRARIAQYDIDDFVDVFGKVERSPFLRGETGGWRGCTFDWIIKKGNFQKVLEGNYDQ